MDETDEISVAEDHKPPIDHGVAWSNPIKEKDEEIAPVSKKKNKGESVTAFSLTKYSSLAYLAHHNFSGASLMVF